jgi:hypothetical protein
VKLQCTRTTYSDDIPILCSPWPHCLYHTTVTYHLPLTDRQTLKTSTTWVYYRRTLYPSSFWKKNPDIGLGVAGYIPSGEIFQFFSLEFLRPSNFLFQIARGSGATLSECLFLWKCAHHSRIFSRKTTSRFLFERTWIKLVSPGETWRNKKVFEFNHKMLGGLLIRDPQGSSKVLLLAMGPTLAHKPNRRGAKSDNTDSKQVE